jgi:uncharacterized protein YbjT (DUF2867 family)
MVLATSATGTVGSEIVKKLKAQGLPVTAASRDPGKAETSPTSTVGIKSRGPRFLGGRRKERFHHCR